MSDDDKDKENGLAVRLLGALRGGTIAIADLMRSAGVERRSVSFNTALWRAQDRYREETGHQVVERSGMLVILDRGTEQLKDGIRKMRQGKRKNERAQKVLNAVRPDALDPVEKRKLDRARDKIDGRLARDTFSIVHLDDEQRKALEAGVFVVRRERRPKGVPGEG